MSSANLPRPRSRRFSSLRGRGLPTQFLLSVPELTCWSSGSYVLKSRRAALDGQPGAAVPTYFHLRAACNPSINFCTFFRPSGSSSPPATDVNRPKTVASPCQATFVPLFTGDKSNPAVSETFPPATLPCPLYCARLGRSASASCIFTSAVPLMEEIPTFTLTVKWVASCCVMPWKSGSKGANLLGSVRKSYTSSGVFLTSNSPPNLIAITSDPLHILRGQLDRFEHVLISRAAAGVPSDSFANIFFTRLLVAGEKLGSREHKPRSAISALKAVTIAAGCLNGMKSSVLFQAFDCCDLRAIRLHREHGARFHSGAVHQNRARSAISCIAADVRPREIKLLAQEFDQQHARLDV